MVNSRLTSLVLISISLILSACSNNDNDTPTDQPLPFERTYVVFSPATRDMPLPNDILFGQEPAADGTMFAGSDPANPVITGIDYLDGNSVVGTIDIQFSAPLNDAQVIDATSFVMIEGALLPNPIQNIFLLPLSYPSGDALLQAEVGGTSVEIPTFAEAAQYQAAVTTGDITLLSQLAVPTARAELISLDGDTHNTVRITPLHPLQPETKYLVVVTALEDAAGNPVYPSIAYDYIKDPTSNLGDTGLDPVRAAINGWEQLAEGYLGFVSSVYEAAGVPVDLPGAEDIIFTLTFTTAGTDTVLKSVAAPEYFFEKSLRTRYKQEAISKLVSGTYNLSGDNSGMTSITDGAINSTLAFLLTSPQLPDTSPNPLYNTTIATAIAGGATYPVLSTDASAAHIMQRAAAEAAISVHNSGSAEMGDIEPYVDIATEAQGTVAAMAQASEQPVNKLFPVPAPRENSFYRVDLASNINPALVAPALVYQGQINLPVFQALPVSESDGSNVATSTWKADIAIGGILDVAGGNDPGTTPPSEMITYRYPFPTKSTDVTVPLLATLPEPTTLANFGLTKPANGWPVVIFVHGITTDRTTSLPMADALAFACVAQDLSGPSGAPCFATIALDQPLHGATPGGGTVPGIFSVTDPDNLPVSNLLTEPSAELTERHYDFTADAASNPVPMDYSANIGDSGGLFINLKHFANSRDTMRQMVVDLLNLNASLATMDVDGDGEANDLDTNKVYLIGHSLGGIDGLTFLAVNNDPSIQNSPFSALPKIQAASAMFPGGEVTRLLVNSQSFGPRILPGLATASEELVQGKSALELYLSVYQGIFDSTDPINFVGSLAATGDTGLLFSEIIGNGSTLPSDVVIPNAADTLWGANNGPLSTTLSNGFVIDNYPAPLAGSEPLFAQAQAIKMADVEAGTEPVAMLTRYIEGSHSTPVVAGNTEIDPLTSAAVFNEIIQQTVTFFALDGLPLTGPLIINPEVIEP